MRPLVSSWSTVGIGSIIPNQLEETMFNRQPTRSASEHLQPPKDFSELVERARRHWWEVPRPRATESAAVSWATCRANCTHESSKIDWSSVVLISLAAIFFGAVFGEMSLRGFGEGYFGGNTFWARFGGNTFWARFLGAMLGIGLSTPAWEFVPRYMIFRRHHRQPTTIASGTPIAEQVVSYLDGVIRQERERVLGDGSELQELHQRTDNALTRAITLRDRVSQRIREEEEQVRWQRKAIPEYLIAAHERISRVAQELTDDLATLRAHEAKFGAFFDACEAYLRRTAKPIDDLELIEAVDVLDAEGKRMTHEVEAAILRSTTELCGRLAAFRDSLGTALTEAGVHLALQSMQSEDLDRDSRILRDTIARFQPPVPEHDDTTAMALTAARTTEPLPQ